MGKNPSVSGERLIAPAEEAEQEPPPLEDLDDGQIDGQEGEEVEPLRKAPSPAMPSAAEVEEHRLTHVPYRCWCPECNMGRGLGEQRGTHAGRAHEIPIVGVDFWYITTGGIKRRDEVKGTDEEVRTEREDGRIIKCLIVRCYATKSVFAHVIPSKGTLEDSYVVDLVCSDVAWLGHVKLILKGDNERALVALIDKSLKVLRCQVESLDSITAEHSQAYDSQSNGGTEVGIRAVRGLFRTMKLCLEKRVGFTIPVNHPLTAWLVEHVCMVLNTKVRGDDGKTAWARARGRPYGMREYGFGESVLWKPPTKGPQHDTEGNMAPRLLPGLFLGFHKSSNSYRVIDEKGDLVKTRAINRLPFENRWNGDKIKAITVTPWSLRAVSAPARVEVGPAVEKHAEPAPDIPPLPRRLKITMKLLNEYGYSEGCAQCDHIRRYNETKPGLTHTEACRQRIVDGMIDTPEGKVKYDQYEERVNRAIAARGPQETTATAPPVDRKSNDVPTAAAAATLPRGNPHEQRSELSSGQGLVPGSSSDAPMQDNSGRDDEMARDDGDDAMGDEAGDISNVNVPKVSDDDDCLMMLMHLGVQRNSYQREHKKAMRRLVSEIYSPPRVTKMLSGMKGHPLAPGFALDITCTDPDDGQPWDFDMKEKRDKARKLLRETKPLFLIGSPMCTAWCTWQRINNLKRDPGVIQRELTKARLHLQFVVELYREQLEAGRYFLHEQPRSAASWEEKVVESLAKVPGVEVISADQCQLGAEVPSGPDKGQPVKKATGFMSNAVELLKHLNKRCHGNKWCSRSKGGEHVTVQGALTKKTAIYSSKLCRAIIKGMTAQLHADGRMKPGEIGIHALDDDEAVNSSMKGPSEGFSGAYRDDLTKQVLRDDLVHEARRKELDYFTSKGVWVKKPKAEARLRTGRGPISVRWVDVNKGDDLNPRYRSRLVARQMKAHDKSGISYFAPTPPLEALRTVLSMAASEVGGWKPILEPDSERRMQVSFVDIARAYFNAKVDPDDQTYVSLPAEDDDHEQMCAKLVRHMYGTRAAADGWQEEYSSFLVETLGFAQGTSSPCVFRHPVRQLVTSVHGDDFTTAGAKCDLDWYEEQIKKKYECTIQPRIGPGKHDAKEAIVLNRVIRWTHGGLEYEADPRQAEKLVNECGLAGSNSVATPGVRLSHKEVENDEPLEPRLHTAFRAAAARANYLAADRLDCQYAAKEICRHMSSPCKAAWNALKRLCRYLVGLPRMVFKYPWQRADAIEVYTDTDFAGCPRTRKSTSGGCVLVGRHTIKSWSSTQSSVALSSGEAEFNGVVRGSGVGLGYQSLLRDLGLEVPLRVWTDSSAAIGICNRQGLGGVRHLDTHTLWVQQAVRCRKIDLRKVDGEVNPADVFTKHSLTRARLMKLVDLFECAFRGGRAESAPTMRTHPSGKITMADMNGLSRGDDDGDEGQDEEADPVMPHKEYSAKELDSKYPPLKVPDDDDCDYGEERGHPMLKEGNRIAKIIVEDAKEHGRKKRAGGDFRCEGPTVDAWRSC